MYNEHILFVEPEVVFILYRNMAVVSLSSSSFVCLSVCLSSYFWCTIVKKTTKNKILYGTLHGRFLSCRSLIYMYFCWHI